MSVSLDPVYLDHAATAPMRPEAVEAMLPYLTERFGNPSGSHAVAREARKALDEARDVVAECLGAEPGEVVFTGGGTEADNLAILGTHALRGGRVICTAVEHHAVLHARGAWAATWHRWVRTASSTWSCSAPGSGPTPRSSR